MPIKPANGKIKAYYDGKCPMCSAIMESVRHSAKHDAFDLRDMHKERSLPFKGTEIEKEIHVIDKDGNIHRGAEAIFKIAEQYSHLQLATRMAQLPPIRALAPVVYRFVAANRRFMVGPASRLFWLKAVIIAAFCTGLLLSSGLWTGPRTYPAIPISSLLPALGGFAAQGLFAALFALAILILVSPQPQKFIAAFLAIVGVFCMLDQTRWQPWVFQYSFLLVVLALFSWQSDDADGLKRTLNTARLVIACTYIFSGLQKVNFNFIENDFPWIVQPITRTFPFTTGPFHIFGAGAPLLQVAFGIGLLTKQFRRVSLIVAVAMHLFILAMFGPAGHNWNNVIWPWTAAMAVFDILLFAGKTDFSMREIVWTRGHHIHVVALVLFGMLPFLSFFNLWDSYLSSALYSGNLNEAVIYLSDAGQRPLPATITPYLVHTSPNTNVLNIQHWAIEDINVTPYPETRVYKNIAKIVCSYLTDPSQLVLIVREQRMFFSRPETGYRCREL